MLKFSKSLKNVDESRLSVAMEPLLSPRIGYTVVSVRGHEGGEIVRYRVEGANGSLAAIRLAFIKDTRVVWAHNI